MFSLPRVTVPAALSFSTTVATHLNQILHKHAHELLGHEEVQQLMQLLAKSSPKLAEELV
ncbi:FHIPEP family type III secretion protein, partial [Enterobacter kobei]